MPIGAVIVGLAMIGITQISAIWHFYLLRGVAVAIGFAFMGQLMTSVTISKWFIRKRGRALAISRIGSNASNVITIPLATYVITAYGWQAMFGIFGLATWVFVLVPSAVIMRRRPEDMGLYPDGIKPGILEKENREEKKEIKDESFDSEERSWSRREVMMTASFWMLSLCFGINSLAFQGINISLAPYVQDLGYSDVMLNMVLMFRAIFGAVSLPLIGFLAEHTNRLSVRLSPFIIQAIGALFFIAAGNVHYLWLGVAAYILGGTAVQIIQDVILADYFGRPSLGTVRSLAFFIGYGFGSVGPIAMNVVYDILGSYELAFTAIMCLFVLSAIVMSMTHPPKKGNVTPAFKT
jgi:MFS family permease